MDFYRTYFNLKLKLVLAILRSKWYNFLLAKVIPFVRLSGYYNSMTGKKYKKAYRLLKPADIILTKDSHKLTTLLIGGKYSHACLCVNVGENIDFEIAEMTHVGFHKISFYDAFRESDHLVILRCRDFDEDYKKKVVEKCLSLEGKNYDNSFQFSIKSLYCSELVYISDYEKILRLPYSNFLDLGIPYISPTDLLNAKNVDVIYNSDEDK